MSGITIISPTPLEDFSPLPAVGMPTFPGEALRWVNNLTINWVPGMNNIASVTYQNALAVQQIAAEIETATTALLNAAATQLSGGNGRLWVAGESYSAATATASADVVLDPNDVSIAYRCRADVSGSSTPPGQDPDHWTRLNGLPYALQEAVIDLGDGTVIDASIGAVFKKTVTGSTTFSVINPASVGYASSFVLELTNAGAHAVTFWPGTQWTNGVVPALSASGKDRLGFYTSDGGATWTVTVVALNVS